MSCTFVRVPPNQYHVSVYYAENYPGGRIGTGFPRAPTRKALLARGSHGSERFHAPIPRLVGNWLQASSCTRRGLGVWQNRVFGSSEAIGGAASRSRESATWGFARRNLAKVRQGCQKPGFATRSAAVSTPIPAAPASGSSLRDDRPRAHRKRRSRHKINRWGAIQPPRRAFSGLPPGIFARFVDVCPGRASPRRRAPGNRASQRWIL